VSNTSKRTPLVSALLTLCRESSDAQHDRLDSTTLADLLDLAAQREPMWYI
jgi:hypothetical protein